MGPSSLHTCMLSDFNHVWLLVTLSPPGSSVHGILQVGLLKWIAMPSSRGSSWPKYGTCVSYVSCIGSFITSTTWTWVQMLNCFFCQISWVTDVSFSHRKFILNLDSMQKILSGPNTVLYLSTDISWLKEHPNACLEAAVLIWTHHNSTSIPR